MIWLGVGGGGGKVVLNFLKDSYSTTGLKFSIHSATKSESWCIKGSLLYLHDQRTNRVI